MPRPVEAVIAGAALVVLAPLLLAIALLVRLTSRGPVLYRQQRVGLAGEPFTLLKFRTMRVGAEGEGRLTVGRDPRITHVGERLRRHKLDELPQLLNVLRGDMALVGARPEVPEFVLSDLADQALVLASRPGLTDPASLTFTDEAELLAGCVDPAERYRTVVLPAKVRLSADYLHRRTAASDVAVLLRTAGCVLRPSRGNASRPT